MGEPVWTRAAIVGVSERGAHHEHAGSWHLTRDGSNHQVAMVKVLPPGRRAAEYGRSMLTRGTDGVRPSGLPGPQQVRFTTTNWVATLLWWAGRERHDGRRAIPPLDLPVWVDPGEGRVLEVHGPTLEEELLPLRDEGVWLWKRTDSLLSDVRAVGSTPGVLARFGGSVLKEWRDAARQFKEDLQADARPPGDRPAGEVEGVSYETWIQCKALLARDAEVHPDHVDFFTHFRGVPWGRWAAVDAAWTAAAPPQWVRYDFNRFRPTGASWELGY